MENRLQKNFENWLEFVDAFPIIPGFEWCQEIRKKWEEKFLQQNIAFCFDDYGNILLGRQTPDVWYKALQKDDKKFILQAHLDHPGMKVLAEVKSSDAADSLWARYTAVIRGGLKGDLNGHEARVFSRQGEFIGKVLIDKTFTGHNEKFVSFRLPKKNGTPYFLTAPAKNERALADQNYQGWALDNHIGCAAILSLLEANPEQDFLAVLTLDEETGCFGLRHLIENMQGLYRSLAEAPLLLSIEVTPEYPQQNFKMGGGVRWRQSDAQAKLDADFLAWAKTFTLREAVDLQKGQCEAGLWAQLQGRSSCLVVASPFYHNATLIDEWRAEEVAKSDVEDLLNTLQCAASEYSSAVEIRHAVPLYEIVGATGGSPLPEADKHLLKNDMPKNSENLFKIFDHVNLVAVQIPEDADYLYCLKNILSHWNQIHSRFDLPLVKFSEDEWPQIRDNIFHALKLAKKIENICELSILKVATWLGIEVDKIKTIPIHFFIGAHFNASNMSFGVAYSLDKIDPNDVARLLIHELTHWLTREFFAKMNARPLVKTFINEGLACVATLDILEISVARAMNMPQEACDRYQENHSKMSQFMKSWYLGQLLDVKNDRHEAIRMHAVPPPYKISSSHSAWTKYGYFLAIDFISRVKSRENRNLRKWLEKNTGRKMESDFLAYLFSEPQKNLKPSPLKQGDPYVENHYRTDQSEHVCS